MTPQELTEKIQKLQQRMKVLAEMAGQVANIKGVWRWRDAAIKEQAVLEDMARIEKGLTSISLCLGAYWADSEQVPPGAERCCCDENTQTKTQ